MSNKLRVLVFKWLGSCIFDFHLQINLRLILVSGKTREFLFVHSDSAADITEYVYNNWPSGRSFILPYLLAHLSTKCSW